MVPNGSLNGLVGMASSFWILANKVSSVLSDISQVRLGAR